MSSKKIRIGARKIVSGNIKPSKVVMYQNAILYQLALGLNCCWFIVDSNPYRRYLDLPNFRNHHQSTGTWHPRRILAQLVIEPAIASIRPKWWYTVYLQLHVFIFKYMCLNFQGGIYVLQIIDWYCASFSLMIISLSECVAIAWIYGNTLYSLKWNKIMFLLSSVDS